MQFNADDDELTVEVGTAEVLAAVVIDLHSTTGEVVIGQASVDPGGGPIGTEHVVGVEIRERYEEIVDRVSVRIDSGDRGKDEYDLVRDSADEGLYQLELESVGEEGEQRSDTFRFRVWDVEDDEDGEDYDEETGDSGEGETGGDSGDTAG